MAETSKTYLGFDFGLKHLGIAIAQTITRQANPLTTLRAKQGVPDWQALDKLVQTWAPQGLVVSIPLNMDGTEQPITAKARHFAARVKARYKLPIFEADERLTTREAKQALFEKGGFKALKKSDIDKHSAALILQHWLNEQR